MAADSHEVVDAPLDAIERRAAVACAVIDGLEQPIVACDPGRRIVLANGSARALWGHPGELGTGGVELSFLCFADDDGRMLAGECHPLERALGGEQVLHERMRLLRGTECRLVEVSSRPLLDARGHVLGAVLTLDRIEGEAAVEERARNYAADLDISVEVSGMLAELREPDQAAGAICTVATGATGAMAVLLWEVIDERLELCRHEGALAACALSDLIERAQPGALRARSEAGAVIERLTAECDGELTAAMIGGPEPRARCLTAWHEPLTSGGRRVGVLSIVWAGLLSDLERVRLLIGGLGSHAAMALERSHLLRRLEQAADTDPLTGLANRRVWQESLERELGRARRESRSVCLLLIDLDCFKAYNDRFGHPQGDRLLRDAGCAWSQHLRVMDLLARVGGEEFAVTLPSCASDQARSVAERLRESVPDGQTCSIGVAAWDGSASASELYATADAALYQAKANGRDRVELGTTR